MKYRLLYNSAFKHLAWYNLTGNPGDIYRNFLFKMFDNNFIVFEPYYKKFKKLLSNPEIIKEFEINKYLLERLIISIENGKKNRDIKNSIEGLRQQIRVNYKYYYAYLIDRDGHFCQHCYFTGKLQIDHILALTKGGNNDYDNLQLLCGTCNLKKSNK